MGTITKRVRKNGSIAYRAQIVIQRRDLVHRESRTFSRLVNANEWIRQREGELERPGELEKAAAPAITVGSLIRKYVKEYEALNSWGRSKSGHLQQMIGMPTLAGLDALKLTAGQLIDHVRQRRLSGTGPATVGNDLTWLGVVLKLARPAWGIPVDPFVVEEAKNFCRTQRLIGRAKHRERRPTPDELDRLIGYFTSKDRRRGVPMVDIMWFALHSTRRLSEITRLRWADNDEKHMTGIVRDAKHPRHKKGNHREFKYTPEAWEIVQRQPKSSERIFPYNPKTISAYFTRACHVLEIEDLRFHDLRHEGTSRLFENGYSIVEVAQFTLHESWQELKRYTNLRPKDLQHR